jgi:hypothetical protein
VERGGSGSIREIVGVFNADGGLLGEVAYVLGRLGGRTHCELCDITHGLFGRRAAFDRTRGTLAVPLTLVHRNELPETLRGVVTTYPCVVAVTDRDPTVLLGPAALADCHTPGELIALLRETADAQGLRGL